MVSAGPALASYHPDDGEVHGPSLGIGLTILEFVVIPIGAFLIIAGLAVLPSALSRPRYRPGKPWDHDPQWFAGPDDPSPSPGPSAPSAPAASEPTARGGASAEW
jgi:hypothetical protein